MPESTDHKAEALRLADVAASEPRNQSSLVFAVLAVTPEQQAHWDKGQEIADGFEALTGEVVEALPGVGHPIVRDLHKRVGELRDFLAASHLPGTNEEHQ